MLHSPTNEISLTDHNHTKTIVEKFQAATSRNECI